MRVYLRGSADGFSLRVSIFDGATLREATAWIPEDEYSSEAIQKCIKQAVDEIYDEVIDDTLESYADDLFAAADMLPDVSLDMVVPY